MSWSTIREATDEDREKLHQRAVEFCERHDLDYDEGIGESAELAITVATDAEVSGRHEAARLRRLWRGVVRRALDDPDAEGIAYGYVGYHVE